MNMFKKVSLLIITLSFFNVHATEIENLKKRIKTYNSLNIPLIACGSLLQIAGYTMLKIKEPPMLSKALVFGGIIPYFLNFTVTFKRLRLENNLEELEAKLEEERVQAWIEDRVQERVPVLIDALRQQIENDVRRQQLILQEEINKAFKVSKESIDQLPHLAVAG